MDENLLICTREIGNHRIKIYYDTDNECPCTNWDMAACYLWEYNRANNLSDVCNWKEVFGKYGNNKHSLEDALRYLICYHIKWKDLLDYFKKGKVDDYRMRYDRSERMWYLEQYNHYRNKYEEILHENPAVLRDYEGYANEFIENLEEDVLIQIINDLGKDIFAKSWSTTGYSHGDYVEGVAFCTKERYAKMVNTDTSDWKTKIDALIDDEVKSIGMWMWGDVKGYVLEKKVSYTKQYHDEEREDEEDFDWEEVDSCWGYYLDEDELVDEVISEHHLKEVA